MLVRAATVCAVLLTLAGCDPSRSSPDRDDAGAGPAPSGPPVVGEPVEVGRAPAAVAVGEGIVWVVNATDGTVSRIDARSGRVDGPPVPVSAGPRAVAAGAGGAWVATASGSVERLTPGGRRPAARARVEDPAGLAVVGDTVWVSSRATGTVVRLDAATGRVRGAPVRVGGAPGAVAGGGDTVWVSGGDDGVITPVDAGTAEPGERVELTDGTVLDLAAGQGALWAAVATDPVAQRIEVLRLDPETGERDGDPVRLPGGVPVRLAAGDAGVWVSGTGSLDASGAVSGAGVTRLDPRGGKTAGGPVDAAERPSGLAVGEGAAWVADQAADTVVPIRPR